MTLRTMGQLCPMPADTRFEASFSSPISSLEIVHMRDLATYKHSAVPAPATAPDTRDRPYYTYKDFVIGYMEEKREWAYVGIRVEVQGGEILCNSHMKEENGQIPRRSFPPFPLPLVTHMTAADTATITERAARQRLKRGHRKHPQVNNLTSPFCFFPPSKSASPCTC
jgi:hypothetical protein